MNKNTTCYLLGVTQMREKWTNRYSAEQLAFLSACLVGLLTHLFGLVNVLHNYDDIAQQPQGYGTGVTSGRWLLSVLGDLAQWLDLGYNLSVVNGVLFLVLLGVSAALTVAFFQVRDRGVALLIGALFAVFPSACATLVFRYTAVYYGIGILLSVLAAWVLLRYRYGIVLSALCTAGSLGIYQAYVPMTIGMLVLHLILACTEGRRDFRSLMVDCLKCCAALILGLCLYFLLLNGTLALYGTTLSDYQGVDSMGKLQLSTLPGLVKLAYYGFCMMPLRDYCGLASMKIIRIVYLLLGALSVLGVGYLLRMRVKNPLVAALTLVLCILLPLAINFVVVMCPDSWIYTLMVYAFVLVPCVPLLLLKHISQEGTLTHLLRKAAVTLVAILIACYAYQTNVQYTALYFFNRQIENYVSAMVTQIRMTEGFDTTKKWAFLGDIQDPLLASYWEYEVEYGGVEYTYWMLRRYSRNDWIMHYVGYGIPAADQQTVNALWQDETVKQMPCWPDYGSIRVLGDTVVIKCAEQPE